MLTTLAVDRNLIPLLAIVGGCSIAIVAIFFSMIKSIVVGRALEQTRREVAAYVAEGSMSPDDAERILKASPPKSEC